jgi:hypothetical protein
MVIKYLSRETACDLVLNGEHPPCPWIRLEKTGFGKNREFGCLCVKSVDLFRPYFLFC